MFAARCHTDREQNVTVELRRLLLFEFPPMNPREHLGRDLTFIQADCIVEDLRRKVKIQNSAGKLDQILKGKVNSLWIKIQK